MILNIYDVGHGFCGYVRDSVTGANLLIDCGYNERTGFHPIDDALTYGPLGGLVIQNFDEDHMDGVPHLIEVASALPSVLYTNPSLSEQHILAMKTAPYGDGLLSLLALKRYYNAPLPAGGGPARELSITQYWNAYPVFKDTNNLSLVTFVHSPAFSVVFPGDLECEGWRTLLVNPAFRRDLARVKVFVASHHAREGGYCAEVFDYCSPEVVVVSDGPRLFDTQKHDLYSQHASGIVWSLPGGHREVRRVLTTRCDGHLRIFPWAGQHWILPSAA